jgi:putative ABC transport system substrate-binding protein
VASQKLWAYDEIIELFKKSMKELDLPYEVEYLEETYINFLDSEYKNLDEMAKAIIKRDDYDLLLTLGTVSTKVFLENNSLGRKIIGMAISDPISSGIVADEAISNIPNFTTVIYDDIPARNMFAAYHEMFNFKKLGIMHHDSLLSNAYTFLSYVREEARERGFGIVEYGFLDEEDSLESCMEALNYLVSQGIDSIYIPTLNCFNTYYNDLKEFYDIVYANKIIPISSEDKDQVRKYALVGFIFSESSISVAAFHANQAVQIFAGVKPEDIPMSVHSDSEFIINLAAAERLGLTIDLEFLSYADILFLDLPGMY